MGSRTDLPLDAGVGPFVQFRLIDRNSSVWAGMLLLGEWEEWVECGNVE